MKVKLQIPRILQQYTAGKKEFAIHCKSVGEALAELKHTQPALYVCICDETDQIRKHLNLFVNDELLVDGLKTKVKNGDVIFVFQSVSGG